MNFIRNVFLLLFILLLNTSITAQSSVFVEVIVTKTVVLTNPSDKSTAQYSIVKGNLFPFIKKQNDYVKIYLESATSGWVHSSTVSINDYEVAPKPSIATKINQNSKPYYSYSGQENYRFPSRSSNQNFDINSDGFVEIKASGRSYYPNDFESPLWQTIVNDPVYKKIPRDVLLGPIDVDTRSRISLEGKLSEDLYIYYDIEQEPEMPGKYDVDIKYKDHHLQFFHLNAAYNQGNYINVQKSLRGAQYRYDDSYNLFQVSMGKERSESHKLENFGSGSKLIKLTHKYIYPGSVRVYINNKLKAENQDYTIDYYEGSILFNFPVEKTDYYKIIYEVSNPIADYLPVLARKNFQAIQYKGSSRSVESYSLITLSQTDNFVYQPDLPPSNFPTFNISSVKSVLDKYSSQGLNILDTLIAINILKEDYTLENYLSTTNVLNSFEFTITSSDITLIADELDLLFVETALYQESLLEKFSDVQLFPDSFMNIEGITLKDSLNIFYALVEEAVLNQQGFITSDLLNRDSVFQEQSSFFFYNDIIITWLKSFFLENKQSSRPRFILSKQPVSLGSLSLTLNDVPLVINQDFSIDYTLGIVSMIVPLRRNDVIDASYDYHIRDSHINEFIGKNITGPYKLSFYPVIDGAAKVVIDEKILKELDDYILDYDSGELYFNYDVTHPSIISVHYDYIQQKKVTKSSKERPFDLGVTYVNEFVPADQQTQIMAVVSENIEITNSLIELSNTPLTNTPNIKLAVGGVMLTTQNYTISSNYKGEIRLIDSIEHPNITSETKAIITYEYLKSYRTKDSITPKTVAAQTTPYNIDGIDYIIDYFPVKYNGVHYITYQGTKLESESFDIDYRNDGMSMVITFYLSSEKPGSLLDSYPEGPFTIHYDYTPQESDALDDIRHHMLGTTIKGNITDAFSIGGEFVFTENNFGGQISDFEMPNKKGNGIDNFFFDLGKTNIIENSEQIFLNNESQTRDVDYVIIYKNGKFRFINKTPSISDVISADFQYSEKSGVLQTSTKQAGYATQISADYETPSLNISSAFKYIDQDFSPIGSINESVGNSIFDSSLQWDVSPGLSFDSNYSRQKQIAKINEENKTIYKHTDIFSTNMKNRYFNIISADHGFNYRFSLQDPDEGYLNDYSHDVDDLTVSYKGSFSFGPPFLKSTILQSFSRQNIDYIDKMEPKRISSKSSSYATNLNLSDSFFFRSIAIKPSYYQSYSSTLETKAPTSSYKLHKNFDLTSNFSPFQSWSFAPIYKWSNTKNKVSSISDISENKAMSYGVTSRYDPVKWFSTFFSFNHKEDESVLLNQKSNVSDSKQASIKRFTPYYGLLALGVSDKNYLASMIQNSTLSYTYSENNQKKNNRRNLTNSYSNRANLSQLKLIPSLTVNNVAYSQADTNINNYVQSSSVSENHSLSHSESYQGQLNLKPSFFILKYFNFTTAIKYSLLSSSSTTKARSVTGNQTEQNSLEESLSHKLNITPPQFSIPNIFRKGRRFRLGKATLSLSLENFQKNYQQNAFPYLYSSAQDIFSRLAASSSTIDNEDKESYTISSTASPFNLISMLGSLTEQKNYFDRNSFSNAQSMYQNIKNYTSSHSLSPFRFLIISVQANQTRSSQWLLPTINITKTELISTTNSSLSYTNKWGRFYRLTTKVQPIRFLSISGAISRDYIQQDIGSLVNTTRSTFQTETYSATLGIYPLKSLAITGTYSKNLTNQNNSSYAVGESNSQQVSYTPLKTSYASISIQYNRNQVTGYGINKIELENQEIADNTILETKRVNRNYITQTGSLNVDISFPINNAYVQKFTLEGEGHLKDIRDLLETPDKPLSYSISGLVLKGTLEF